MVEDLKSVKIEKTLDNTHSFILTNNNPIFINFILDEINKCVYFRTPSISKLYITKVLGIKYKDIEGKLSRGTSNKVGRIVAELVRLEIVVKHRDSKRSVWRNLYQNDLYDTLNKKMEQKYFMIKLK